MATFHIFDHGIRGAAGHPLMLLADIKALSDRYGFDVKLYAPKELAEDASGAADVRAVLDFEPFFDAFTVLTGDMSPSVAQGVRNAEYFSALEAFDLSRVASDDVLYFTSQNATTLAGLGQWLRRHGEDIVGAVTVSIGACAELTDTEARRLTRNGARLSPESFRALDAERIPNEAKKAIYRYFLDSFPAEGRHRFSVMYADLFTNNELTRLPRDPSISLYPLFAHFPGNADVPAKTAATTRVCFIGSGGVEANAFGQKGTHFLPDVWSDLQGRADAVLFAQVAGQTPGATKALSGVASALQGLPGTTVVNGVLSAEEYRREMLSADVVLLPYGPAYENVSSGIFHDAVYLGTVCVLPENSIMGQWLKLLGVDFPSFAVWDPSAIAASLSDAVGRHQHYSTEMARARDVSHRNWEQNNPVAVSLRALARRSEGA